MYIPALTKFLSSVATEVYTIIVVLFNKSRFEMFNKVMVSRQQRSKNAQLGFRFKIKIQITASGFEWSLNKKDRPMF